MFLEDNYDIDIPDSMTCLSNYNATLGHKVMMTYILLQLYKCDDNKQVKGIWGAHQANQGHCDNAIASH